jgi:hypothetical protein
MRPAEYARSQGWRIGDIIVRGDRYACPVILCGFRDTYFVVQFLNGPRKYIAAGWGVDPFHRIGRIFRPKTKGKFNRSAGRLTVAGRPEEGG